MKTTQKISLDFAQRGITEWIAAVQGDSYTRAVELSLYSNGQAWTIPDGVSVQMRYRLPDGTGDAYDTLPDGSSFWTASENILTVMLAPQMLVIPGLVAAQIQITNGNETIATFSFIVTVEPDPSAGVPESQKAVSWANWTKAELSRIVEEFKESGEFDGYTPVKGTDYWTDTDKQEIVDKLNEQICPVSYNAQSLTEEQQAQARKNIGLVKLGKFDPTVYGMPIVYLEGDTSQMSKENKVTLNYAYGDRNGTASVKWQGTSSIAYPKKNYSISFDTAFEAKAGWGMHKDYCLKANWIDFSHARNVVSAMLWKRFNDSNSKSPFKDLPNGGAIDGFPCMVVINGEYQGLYSFTIPKKPWLFGMDESNLTACIIGGGEEGSATKFETESVIDESGKNFELEYLPEGADETALINSFKRIYTKIGQVNGYNTTFNEEYGLASVLDIKSAFNYYVYSVLTCNRDGLAKNVLYVTVDGNKWFVSPYDLDGTFGNVPRGVGYYPNQDHTFQSYATCNKLFNALYNNGNAPYLKNYYINARTYYMREVDIMDKFYNYLAQIPKAVLDEEVRLWPGIPGTNTNDIHQIIEFYKQRVAILDAEIEALVSTQQ